MPQYAVGRDDVLSVLSGVLEPLDHVQAMWEAGAIAFDRVGERRELFDLFRVLSEKEPTGGT
jgi:hypothetical protein